MTAQPTLAPSQLAPHPRNPRRDVGNVDDLAASAKEVGILEPIVVAPPFEGITGRGAKADYLVLCGHRRLAAAKKARLKAIPVVIRDDLTTLGAQLDAMLVENLHRVDLTPVEEGDAYQQVLELDGITQQVLAARIGQPRRRISQRIRISKASNPIRDAVHLHHVSISDALALAELDDHPDLQQPCIDAIGTNDFAWHLNRAKDRIEERKKTAKALAAYEKAGVTVHAEMPSDVRPLAALPRVGEYSYPYILDHELEAEVHGECPGRTVWTDAGGTLRFGCSEPDLHRPQQGADEAAAEDDAEWDAAGEAAQRAAEREERDASFAAATKARDDFVTDLLCKGGPPPEGIILSDTVVRLRLVALILEQLGVIGGLQWPNADTLREVLAQVALGPRAKAAIEELGDDTDALGALLKANLAERNVHNLVAVLDVVIHLEAARWIRRVVDPEAQPWLEALRDYGYQFSTFEQDAYKWRLDDLDEDEPLVQRWWTTTGEVVTHVEPDGEDA